MYRAIVDTEFLSTPRKAVYDFGFCIMNDKTGKIVTRARFVIAETIIYNDMSTAYYADKMPAYVAAIESGAVRVVSRETARTIFIDTCKAWHVSQVWAYYALADITALNQTYDGEFLPAGMTWHCINAAAAQTICNSRNYFKFAVACGFVSDKGNVRTTANSVGAYVLGNPAFAEEHTALADAELEAAILYKVLRQHTHMDSAPRRDAYKACQTKFKAWQAA